MTPFEVDQVQAFYRVFRDTGLAPMPMPPWRARQHWAFLREAPEPVFWGRAFCASAWVLAFLAVALVAFEWGSIVGFKEAISIVVPSGGLK